jgi:pimeloyl-ACP methyl ester carboxylesterase
VPSGTEAAHVAALLKAADGTEPIDTLHYRALDRAGSPSLTSYWLGKGAATVVLVNALAMPVEVLEPMMQELRFGRTVLTWESRSLLDLREPFDAATVEANASVAELARLVTEAKKDAVDLVAWCNGALIALDFALRWPERVRKLVLLNAPLGSGGGPSTEYAGSLGTLLETAAKSRKRAAVLGSILAQAETDPTTVARREAPSAAVLRHHVRRPFRSAEDLFRYATAMRAQAASPTERLDIPQETLLVLSEHDAIVGNERALEWAKSRPNVRVEVLRDADHWALHGDARVARIVDEFLRAPAERATVAPLHCLHLNR